VDLDFLHIFETLSASNQVTACLKAVAINPNSDFFQSEQLQYCKNWSELLIRLFAVFAGTKNQPW